MNCWHCGRPLGGHNKSVGTSFVVVIDPIGHEHEVHKICRDDAVADGNKAQPEPQSASLRARRQDGSVATAAPHDPLYSTVTMVATHYWDVKNKSWREISP